MGDTKKDRYRKADIVELHDANVVMHIKNFDNLYAGFLDSNLHTKGWLSVDMREIAAYFPIEKPKHGHFPIEITMNRPVIGDSMEPVSNCSMGNFDINSIEVQVIDSKQINIRFTHTLDFEEGIKTFTREITYSGSYTIWWSV